MEKFEGYEIDWEEQWMAHAPGFKDGFLTFSGGFCEIRLKAGPGFGDFSHPTTRLALERMREIILGRVLVDIGCGSGILSCCAVAMGADHVYGVDIDLLALGHARENVKINGLEGKIECFLAEELSNKTSRKFKGGCVAVMNMIQSEQVEAWQSLAFLHDRIDTIVTSGILEEDEQKYFSLCKSWGWTLLGKSVEDGWCAYTFSK